MTTLLGISGSLGTASFNAALLRAARDPMPDGSTLETGAIAEIPLHNGDREQSEGIPAPMALPKQAIAGAQGLLIVTPECDNSVPGVLKNAIDWLSRPASDIPRVFGGRPVALMGASPGGFGTILSQNARLPVFKTLGAQLWSGDRLLLSRAREVLGEDGSIRDEKIRDRLQRFLQWFEAFARSEEARET